MYETGSLFKNYRGFSCHANLSNSHVFDYPSDMSVVIRTSCATIIYRPFFPLFNRSRVLPYRDDTLLYSGHEWHPSCLRRCCFHTSRGWI